MKKQWKCFLAGALASVLAIGALGSSVAAYQRQETLHFNGISLVVDGEKVSITDSTGAPTEPFIINGTTYLPVGNVAKLVGYDVAWDGKTQTVTLSSGQSDDSLVSVQMLGFYKILEENFSELETYFDRIENGVYTYNDFGHKVLSDGETMYSANISRIDDLLELTESHYENCYSYLTDSDKEFMTECRRLSRLAKSYFTDLNDLSLNSPYASTVINRVETSASQGFQDASLQSLYCNSCFWDTYQAAFS